MRPAIGIPLCLDARGRWREGRDYVYLDAAYARAVEAAGGLPVLLPHQPAGRAAELIARIDALLLPGGDDFAPDRPYPASVAFDLADPAQIEFDRALLREATAAGKPVLGICYGMQLLALEAGGALHHHVPLDVADPLDHGGGTGTTEHELSVEGGSLLESWIGGSPGRVNSRHHQAVADAGRLAVAAVAPDGVIEASEGRDGAPRIGVQWHPESLPGAAGEGLLRAFVTLAAGASR